MFDTLTIICPYELKSLTTDSPYPHGIITIIFFEIDTHKTKRNNLVEFAVILAVGSSLHQSQLTYSRPRVMLPVLGKPMVVRTMERLYRAGIHKTYRHLSIRSLNSNDLQAKPLYKEGNAT